MPSKIAVLVKKELKELLRDPKILLVVILVPSLMFVVLGEAFSFATQKTVEEAFKEINVAFIDNDNSWASQMLLSVIKTSSKSNVEIFRFEADEDKILSLSNTGKYDLIVIVPKGFSENITKGTQAKLEIISVVKGLSFSSTIKPSVINSFLDLYRESMVKNWLKQAFPDKNPEYMLRPFIVENNAVLKGKLVPETVISSLISQMYLVFIGPFILLSMVASIASASIGVEKEEKTLETLLSFPISGSTILFSKAIAVVVIGIIGTISMSLGLLYYMSKIFGMAQVPAQEPQGPAIGFSMNLGVLYDLLGITNIVLIVLGIFFTLFLILTISLVIGSLTNNVREAQAIAGYIWLPIFIPALIIMFVDISSLGRIGSILVSLMPFATPLIAIKASFENIQWAAPLSFAANLLYLAAVFYLGKRWFEGEKILTARIRFGGGKFRRKG